MPKRIDPAVRARAVRMVREHHGSYASLTAAIVAVASQEQVAAETVRRWVRQAEVDAGERPGPSSDELAENKRLRAENARLREDVAILKAAAAFFAGELDPRNR